MRFDLFAKSLRLGMSLVEIRCNLILVTQVMGDDRVDVSQLKDDVSTNHILRSHAVSILLDDQIQRDAGLTNANHAAPTTSPLQENVVEGD